ncbi:MAG: N(4)-(beta-N-acetylglucosaminyl)-L-asparaginase [Prolixibacteraceae bacterium]|jgi:N4-(beta-N-acetylglucosaminyl)-L-asparaginase|nr:N(4)-(beta-N-acetylglucosaminyl)-L-asparaginase [Prolixibacteraceae bacterium]MBT6765441.1 N(4)-(beta-N-acetylglucosaminyl)-L-asparaginase [Prolixibacteraceae bacterium]MBT6999823.1 N(4)-(beta-N-acetylglucosaminyl)-L-asparaginase [Prolixibacteraceae bacterium]MBT7394976.1 N(4)-(beta-N-acetylglucosaminyl)-L-asparaginase [Prolixibacteraceae bacterium]
MTSRRSFIRKGSMAFAGLSMAKYSSASFSSQNENNYPIVISTWNHGLPANEAAWKILSEDGHSLDAVEAGVRIPEADPKINSVGFGGTPDASGKVTLDACIMDEKGRAGSVSYLKHIKHPISVARLVMEKTQHVMLSGKGALEFALGNGFKKEKLLTSERKSAWKKWKKEKRGFSNEINVENHDTIGMLAIDKEGRISGACTTSGMGYKLPGRVGDSPIIGAGLFVDGEVGGAVATGTGELVMKTMGTFLVVELMRNGMSPSRACEEAVKRISKKIPDYENHQIGYIALNKSGVYGSFCIQPGFNYAVKTKNKTELEDAESWLKTL